MDDVTKDKPVRPYVEFRPGSPLAKLAEKEGSRNSVAERRLVRENKIDKEVKLRLRGFSYDEIGKQVGENSTTIKTRVKKVIPEFMDGLDISVYQKSKAEVFEFLQLSLLHQLDKKRQAKMSGRDLVYTIAMLQEKIEKIRGQNTNQNSILQIIINSEKTIVVAGGSVPKDDKMIEL